MINNLKLTLGLSLLCTAFSFNANAQTCGATPNCAALGFTYTADQCGTLPKMKCPFGDAYFCDPSCPDNYVTTCPSGKTIDATVTRNSLACYTCKASCDDSYDLTVCPIGAICLPCSENINKMKFSSCKTGYFETTSTVTGKKTCIKNLVPDPLPTGCINGMNELVCNGTKYCCPSTIRNCLDMKNGTTQCLMERNDNIK